MGILEENSLVKFYSIKICIRKTWCKPKIKLIQQVFEPVSKATWGLKRGSKVEFSGNYRNFSEFCQLLSSLEKQLTVFLLRTGLWLNQISCFGLVRHRKSHHENDSRLWPMAPKASREFTFCLKPKTLTF